MPATIEQVPQVPAGDATPLQINPAMEYLARWLDDAIPIPGTPWRVGLDGLIGLVPVVGDVSTVFSGLLMLAEARRLGVPASKQAVIVAHYVVDTLVGMVPILGDVFDFAYKANRFSMDIIKAHVEARNREHGTPSA